MNPSIAPAEVSALRASGQALPLLDTTVSPVRIGSVWWAIAEGETTYLQVDDAAAARLDAAAARLSASRAG